MLLTSKPCVSPWRQEPIYYLYIVLVLVQSSTVLGVLELQLDEGQPPGTIVGDISVGLPPGETPSLYFISDHEGTGVGNDLNIDETTGIITTARSLDREKRDHYSFIAVTMTGVTIEVSITVNDINDHAPTFPKKKAVLKIPEHTAIGTRFSLEPATDADKDQLTTQGYTIREGNVGQAFRLETKRAANKVLYLDLVISELLDREKRSFYTLMIEAFDGGSPKRIGSMTLEVTVTDINDHAPVFNQSRYHAIISESLSQGSSILQVRSCLQCSGPGSLLRSPLSKFTRYFLCLTHRYLQQMKMRETTGWSFMKSTGVRVILIATLSWMSNLASLPSTGPWTMSWRGSMSWWSRPEIMPVTLRYFNYMYYSSTHCHVLN